WLRQLACRGTVGDTAELDGAVADVVIDPIVDVDSDASNDPETLPRAPACLAQHTTKLAAAEHQVVGPLEPDPANPGDDLLEHRRHGDADAQRQGVESPARLRSSDDR